MLSIFCAVAHLPASAKKKKKSKRFILHVSAKVRQQNDTV
jgi:hypothetical protein